MGQDQGTLTEIQQGPWSGQQSDINGWLVDERLPHGKTCDPMACLNNQRVHLSPHCILLWIFQTFYQIFITVHDPHHKTVILIPILYIYIKKTQESPCFMTKVTPFWKYCSVLWDDRHFLHCKTKSLTFKSPEVRCFIILQTDSFTDKSWRREWIRFPQRCGG